MLRRFKADSICTTQVSKKKYYLPRGVDYPDQVFQFTLRKSGTYYNDVSSAFPYRFIEQAIFRVL